MENIYIGMGGWELHPFNKYFYPRKLTKGFRKLAYYAQYFDTVEVNATFYNASFTRKIARRWVDDVSENRNFTFTVKLYRGFTHTFDATKEDVVAVCNLLDELARYDKLGGLLIQFPDSFGYLPERKAYVAKLCNVFRQYKTFVEVRHRSWLRQDLVRSFQEMNTHLVNVDLPVVQQHPPLHAFAWDGVAYFRMMGRNRATWNKPWRLENNGRYMVSDRYKYYYSDEELEELVALIERVKASSETIFVIFHNDPEANSLVNGFQLRKKLQSRNSNIRTPLIVRHPLLEKINPVPVDPAFSLYQKE